MFSTPKDRSIVTTVAAVGGRIPRAARSGKPARDPVDAALETCALVLGEDSPLPETDRDVEDLVRLLRAHIMLLGIGLAAEFALLKRARELSAAELPKGYTPSRVHLRKLAEATRGLIEARRDLDEAEDAVPADRRRGWDVRRLRPLSRNTTRIVVFTVAMITLIIAGSTPPG
ncbi:DUF6415 family natural product biosynthesis protein [Streptomyces peucetius]|uniref:DUF6415 family natural product biosynthesis protein n=1 Tax=Streptomyces peucetius TaxID=1950 RepID=A0ABY6I2R9_STRPE|nr:DUF6415 family natural product biosynthesis protein [Streptomyces peucetius]UYQ60040.1 DUF6415 family natural product biosynthesis protein [Streptomyces peucetius]